ncbi:MAG: YfhO family protein [Planctomycetes bacterium]|nr:YfhO family protein [Planctomycetota bacterium]MBL7037324.1 YfhO family protein [Pirellulaceae bacterium]
MNRSPKQDRRRAAFTVFAIAIVVAGLFLWFFGKALFTQRSFVFRDAAHYYYPLFEWSSHQWSQGRVPLWNPQENCGVPVAAEATSSVFYPGKLLFVLPLDFATKYKLYIVGHVLLAAAAAFCLARHWQTSRWAAGLCAISYAFGGNVLFQYCNVVFLVGAAWLPLALVAAHRMLVTRCLLWSLALAAVLALMVLGGDPQAAYHAGLLAAVYALLLWRTERRGSRKDNGDGEKPEVTATQDDSLSAWRGWSKNRFVLLIAAAACAAILAAIQILPSIEWSRHSGRAAFRAPRSMYEIPTHLTRDSDTKHRETIAKGLFGVPARGTHHEHIYHFSVAPWHLAELVWPNISGRLFPVNRRWTNAIPAEGRVWSPSLYMGLLPLLLAISCWRLRGGAVQVRLASWMTLLAILAGLGWYGAGWAIQEFRYSLLGAEADDVLIGQPVGGLYWLLVTTFPGYAYFRYPAKLLVIASLGLSVLAAHGFDRLFTTGHKGLRRVVVGLSCVSLVAMLATYAIASPWSRWLDAAPKDGLFGPIDASGSLADLRIAFLHTAVLGVLIWGLLSRILNSNKIKIAPLLIALTAVDLAIANGWMLPTAPIRHWQDSSCVARQITEREAERGKTEPFRVYRGTTQNWLPSSWAETSSTERQREGLRWEIDTLYPKYHLRAGLSLVESTGTMSSHEYQMFLGAARRHGPKRSDGVAELHPAVIGALGAKYVLAPDGLHLSQMQRIDQRDDQHKPPKAELWLNHDTLPRAWIVHDIVTLPQLRHEDPASIERRTNEVLFPDGQPRDLRETAVVETDSPIVMPGEISNAASVHLDLAEASCEIVVDEPHCVEVVADVKRPGLLVLSDLYYPGWIAEVTGQPDGPPTRAPILRTNRVMRGVYLEPGRQYIVFAYRPKTVYAGAIVSVIGWIALAGAAVYWIAKRSSSLPP